MNLFSKKGLLKTGFDFHPILQNQLVLYFFFFLIIADLFYLANMRDFTTVSIIILTGFLTSFFSKNMIVIMCIGLSTGNVLKYGAGQTREGATTMENADADESKLDSKEKDSSESTKDKKEDKLTETKKKAKDDLMKGLKEFQSVQNDLMSGVEKLQPMLSKAENFIEKYEAFKSMQ